MSAEINARLVAAATKVIDAWHDYVSDEGQVMPAILCDDAEVLDELCAALSEATGREITRMPPGYDVEESIGQPKPEGYDESPEPFAEKVERIMGLVTPLLKRIADGGDTSRNEILVAVGACEQLQSEATEAPHA